MVAIIQERQRVFLDRFFRYESGYPSSNETKFVRLLAALAFDSQPSPSAFCLHKKKYPSRLFEGWFDEWGDDSPDIAIVMDHGIVSAIRGDASRVVEREVVSGRITSEIVLGDLW